MFEVSEDSDTILRVTNYSNGNGSSIDTTRKPSIIDDNWLNQEKNMFIISHIDLENIDRKVFGTGWCIGSPYFYDKVFIYMSREKPNPKQEDSYIIIQGDNFMYLVEYIEECFIWHRCNEIFRLDRKIKKVTGVAYGQIIKIMERD